MIYYTHIIDTKIGPKHNELIYYIKKIQNV